MAYSYFCGWDVSKDKLNYCVINSTHQILEQGEVTNSKAAIAKLLKRMARDYDATNGKLLHGVENTGLYTNYLLGSAAMKQYPIWLEDAFQINRSSGRRTDKTDELDAKAIADYVVRFHQTHCKLYELPRQALLQLREVEGIRKILVASKAKIITSSQERNKFRLHNASMGRFETIIKAQIKSLKKAISDLQAIIFDIIQADVELKQLIKIVRSVPGMGPVTGVAMLIETEAFTKVKTAKACASYAGIAPRRQQSGKLLDRVGRSHKGNQAIKTALHQAAHCLIGHQGIWQDCYKKNRAKGMKYRSAINVVRNKICRVLFACVKNGTMYQKKLHLNLQVL